MMLALIKKDLRVFLVPTVGGLVLISCGYLITAALYLFGSRTAQMILDDDWLAPAASVGSLIVVLLASAYGGSSFTVERREHSSDWLNMFPVTRRQTVASKVVAAFACMAALWIYDLLPIFVIYSVAIYSRGPKFNYGGEFLYLVRMFILSSPSLFSLLASSWILFAFAWLFSTFLESAAISACIGILLMFMAGLTMEGAYHALHLPQETVSAWMLVFLGLAATAGFLFGTRYYLNRVEP